MLNRLDVECALELALATGGDFSELFFEDRETRLYSLLGGQVENAAYTRETGIGVRVLKGRVCAYAHTNELTNAGLTQAALRASELFGAPRAHNALPMERTDFARPVFLSLNHGARAALLTGADAAARAISPEISQVSASIQEQDQRVIVANSLGVWGEDRRVRTRFSVQAVASGATQRQTGHEAPGGTVTFEDFRTRVDTEAYARAAAQTALVMLHAEPCPAAFVPVIIDNGFGGVIFHEACGHALEATAVGEGNSVFCGKLGVKIASDCVSAVDDATLDGEWGSLFMDDEGNPARRNLLIDRGVLRGYLVDTLGGRKMGQPSTGSARRQNYAFAPASRMSNTFILPGEDDESEIFLSLADGLYARRMGGGSVNPLTGEFNFAVREGYWVKNGQIDRPVRGATLIGTGQDVLLNIERVGRLLSLGAGMCGSVSGAVPTCVGQPMIRVRGLTVGGAR